MFVGAVDPVACDTAHLTASLTFAAWLAVSQSTSMARSTPKLSCRIGTLAACVTAAACSISPFAGLPNIPASIIIGVFLGLSFVGLPHLILYIANDFAPARLLVTLAVTSCGALAALTLLCAVVPAFLLPWIFAGLAVLGPLLASSGIKQDETDMPMQTVHPLVALIESGAVEGLYSRQSFLRLLAFACIATGFFLSCSTTMWPKTTHMPALSTMGAPYIGSLNVLCLTYLACATAVVGAVGWGLARKRRPANARVLATIVISLAVLFLLLPFLKETPLVFVAVNTLALVLFTLILPIASAASSWSSHQPSITFTRLSCLISLGYAGACIAAVLLLGPFYGNIPLQDQVFIGLQALGSLCAIIALVIFGEPLIRAFDIHQRKLNTQSAGHSEGLVALCEQLTRIYFLTPRESEVLKLIAEGRNEPYIAQALSISRATVKTHVNHIYKKTGVTSRQQLLDVLRGEERAASH